MCRKPLVEMAQALLKREDIFALNLLDIVFRFGGRVLRVAKLLTHCFTKENDRKGMRLADLISCGVTFTRDDREPL